MSTAEAKSRRAAGLKTPTNLGVEATSITSGEFAAYIKAEAARFAKVLSETGVKLD